MISNPIFLKQCSRRSFCALSACIGFAAFAELPLSGCGSDTTKPFRFADENGNPLEGLEVVYFRYDGSNYADEPTILTTDKHGEVSIDMTAFSSSSRNVAVSNPDGYDPGDVRAMSLDGYPYDAKISNSFLQRWHERFDRPVRIAGVPDDCTVVGFYAFEEYGRFALCGGLDDQGVNHYVKEHGTYAADTPRYFRLPADGRFVGCGAYEGLGSAGSWVGDGSARASHDPYPFIVRFAALTPEEEDSLEAYSCEHGLGQGDDVTQWAEGLGWDESRWDKYCEFAFRRYVASDQEEFSWDDLGKPSGYVDNEIYSRTWDSYVQRETKRWEDIGNF